MKYPQGTLTHEQARTTFFVVPELPGLPEPLDSYTLVLGADGYRRFKKRR